MSQLLINRNADLKKLRDEGFDIEVREAYLLIKNIPYVNSAKQIAFGTLVSELNMAGDVTAKPSTHVVYFQGDHPCNKDGSEIAGIKHTSKEQSLDEGLVIHHSFSSKPTCGVYDDYYMKMTTYAAILSSPAHAIDPSVTPKIFPTIEYAEADSVFNYLDTASSRAGINVVTNKLAIGKVAIVGVGGTGSYVLDLVAKTPVGEIHLFDGDKFLNYNAFRTPGAPSLDELNQRPQKVGYLAERYSKMHRHIVPHDYYLDDSNIDEIHGMDFVFLCLDRGDVKRLIVKRLEEWDISFVDVGMGVELVDDSLRGILRITTSTSEKRDHVNKKNRIPFSDGKGNKDYSQNIQIADLNALNASLAVIKWKKLLGFYADLEKEHYCVYTIDGNTLTSEDQQ